MSAQAKISRRRVVSALVDLLESGTPASRVAQTLAAYLVDSGQTRSVDLYLRDIELALAQRFGVVTAYVSSAQQLNQQTADQIKRLVKAKSGAKTVEMITSEDSSLIGGVVIRTADAELDGSIRTKLQSLRSI